MTNGCPPDEQLSAWLDDEVSADTAASVRAHVGGCEVCAERVHEWDALRRATGDGRASATPSCPHPEDRIAWIAGELSPAEASAIERHVAGCAHCRVVVADLRITRQRIARDAQRALRPIPIATATRNASRAAPPVDVTSGAARAAPVSGRRHRSVLWRSTLAAAAVVLLVVGVVRLRDRGIGDRELQWMGGDQPAVEVLEVSRSDVTARAAPDEGARAIAFVPLGTRVVLLERRGAWLRVRLQDGIAAWVPSSGVRAP